MEGPETVLFTILKTIVVYSLERRLNDNAIFFAERLRGFYPTEEEAVFLVAKSYYAAGKPSVAAHVLRQQVENHVSSAYLFARACFDLERYHEGQEALERVLVDNKTAQVSHEYSSANPDQASIHCVMGELCRNGNKKDEARHHYLQAFEANPFLWTSFEQLCKLNYRFGLEDVENTTQLADLSRFFNEEKLLACYTEMTRGSKVTNPIIKEKALSDHPPRVGLTPSNPPNGLSVSNVTTISLSDRPRRTASTSTSLSQTRSRTTAKPKTNGTIQRGGGSSSGSGKSKETKDPALGVKKPKGVDIRKHSRPQPSTLRSRSVSEDLVEDKVNVDEKEKEPASIAPQLLSANEMDTDKPEEKLNVAIREILAVVTSMAQAFLKLSQNYCVEAIDLLENLPMSQQESGWVLSHIGQARYQLGEFVAADQVFSELRKREPYRMAKMDLYSTVLWQMKQDVKLSYLAHQLVEFDRWSPEAWCAVGNCFSIKFDHMAALKCFQRAIQLNPAHVYAHYLCGMEWMALDDSEKAQACYRNAIKVDDRHYNAWFGLGMIYYRQESYDHAEFHFRRAATINPSNPSLQAYIALVMQKTKRYDQALAYFEKADRLARQPNEALDELHKLELEAQGECNVYFLMGKVYKRLGQNQRAIHYLTMAQDHQAHGSTNIIKDAIDKVSDGIEEDDTLSFDELFKKFE
ncbi:hypothetical protein SmJEL517_g01116 [Synchytrium microbalum]|uniref:Cdc23 domain-containing protein n=1 Tax=Synchytrium microbalum TaxID=1806994 RepID=A0A507CHB7_9FUNG|nr:uncharacterized protein SmJEL517_g01116 [Synchytrium microbalum]TPX37065.1 hypothetical protein SmJEL517_g01116 [Synchytrium microbalum]